MLGARLVGHRLEEPLECRDVEIEAGDLGPLLALGDAVDGAEGRHLIGVHEAGMVVLVAGEGQAPALDCVGDEAVRAIVLDAAEGFEHGLDVMPAEIGHELAQGRVVVALQDLPDGGVTAEIALEMRPPGGTALEGQGRVEVVRAAVDPVPKHLAARPRKGRLELLAVLDRDDGPADGTEELLDLGEQLLRHDPVEALTVVVDHPPEVADVVLPALEQGLVDVALVELGVADDGDHAALGALLGHEAAGADEVLGQGGKERHGDAQAHRAGREVDAGRVLGARGVGLRPAQRPEPLEPLARLAAQEIHGGVVDRARVRLHRDAIARAHHVEEECRQDGGARGAGGLVAAHLELVARRPEMVGVVDGPAREPQELALDRLEHGQPILRRHRRPLQGLRHRRSSLF